jgi:hypothetical protein
MNKNNHYTIKLFENSADMARHLHEVRLNHYFILAVNIAIPEFQVWLKGEINEYKASFHDQNDAVEFVKMKQGIM